MERKKITFDSFIRGSIGCVLVVGILMLVERLSGVLLPFFIAWLIAYMVYPLVKFFQYKLRLKSRIISIFCSLFLITVIGVTLFYLLVPPMISEIGRMREYPGGNQGYRPQSVDFACRISQHSIQHPCLLHYIIICNLYIIGLRSDS